MWIFTQVGYVSVVQNTDPMLGAELVVRARTRRHLEQVLSLALPEDQVKRMIWPTPGDDYPWLAPVDREVVRNLAVACVGLRMRLSRVPLCLHDPTSRECRAPARPSSARTCTTRRSHTEPHGALRPV